MILVMDTIYVCQKRHWNGFSLEYPFVCVFPAQLSKFNTLARGNKFLFISINIFFLPFEMSILLMEFSRKHTHLLNLATEWKDRNKCK